MRIAHKSPAKVNTFGSARVSIKMDRRMTASGERKAAVIDEVVDWVWWSSCFLTTTLCSLKERLRKPDDGPNERKPHGQARPNALFDAELAMGRHPAKTVLVRPVGHISRSPPPRRTFCVRRCPGLCHWCCTSRGMWRGRCKHVARRVHRP